MRGREELEQFNVTKHIAKEFSRFLNNVRNEEVDFLGSFLIENEWEAHIEDAREVIQSLDIAGYVIVPRDPTDEMINSADRGMGEGLMGQRGAASYITVVFEGMLASWVDTHNPNLILDIISMALSRASAPASKRDSSMYDSSFQRSRRHSQEMVAGLDKSGQLIVPDEATPEMVAAGVHSTAEISTNTSSKIGADPAYLASVYTNMVAARPKD